MRFVSINEDFRVRKSRFKPAEAWLKCKIMDYFGFLTVIQSIEGWKLRTRNALLTILEYDTKSVFIFIVFSESLSCIFILLGIQGV